MIGRDPVDAFVVSETPQEVAANPRRRSSIEWKGMTMFAKAAPEDRKARMYPTYIQGDGGLFEANLTYEERKAFEEIWVEDTRNCLVAEVMALKLKASGKELNPKAFERAEWEKFKVSDQREWVQWIDNGVMRRVPKEEAATIPKWKVFKSPLRMVRTNKSGGVLLPLIAKSGLVVLHASLGFGSFTIWLSAGTNENKL